MEYDEAKVDEMALALMYLTSFDDNGFTRSWKSYDWDITDRLHKAGLLHNPIGKSKSVMLTDEGAKRSRELFEKHFGKKA